MSAGHVGEIFSAAGMAFTKLGELTTHLQGVEANPDGHKWDNEDIEQLKNAIRRFGDDLNKLSADIKAKSNEQIKSGIKRKLYDEAGLGGGDLNSSDSNSNSSPAIKKHVNHKGKHSSLNNSHSNDSLA